MTYTTEQLKEILDLHKRWLNNEPDGKQANLRNADLRKADLRKADLRYANLYNADLRYANLRYANLRYADLRYANLRNANLRGADLRGANLRGANLRYADLRYADLYDADLRYANLRNADLAGADIDFSSGIPFRCGELDIKLDAALMRQLAYHFCSMVCEDAEAVAMQNALLDFANRSSVIERHGLPKLERREVTISAE
jgi:uncharacterized protein YjbI with pentapeptide repeats